MNLPDQPDIAPLADGPSAAVDQFASQLIDELKARTANLPSWSQETERVRAALVDDATKPERLVRLLATDVRLAILVLSAVDSPLFGGGGRSLNDLKQAVMRLGHKRLRCITYAAALTQMRNAPRLQHLRAELNHLASASVAVAAVAWLLASHVDGVSPDDAMFAGLMHNVGELCILARLDSDSEFYTDRRARLMLLMRWHAAAGEAFLDSWRLPSELSAAVGAQHMLREHAAGPPTLSDVLAAAIIAARTSTAIDETATHLATFGRFGLDAGGWRELLLKVPVTTTAMRALFSD